jgi:hypothetical protein
MALVWSLTMKFHVILNLLFTELVELVEMALSGHAITLIREEEMNRIEDLKRWAFTLTLSKLKW